MHFVQEIDALDTDIIIRTGHHIGIILKLLDIDHGDFGAATQIVKDAGGLDLLGKILPGINGVNHQPPTGEFGRCLNEQINSIHDEVEFRDDRLPLEIIRQELDVVVG